MDFALPAVIIMHLIGVAMGVGGAITTDATFLRSIWDRTVTKGQLQLIETISKVVVTGLGLLILTGISLVALNPHYLSLSDGSQLFWVKMTLVVILSINGLVFHKKILPILKRHEDKSLASDEVRTKLWLLASTGGLSGISWFSILILGKTMQITDISYFLIMNLYLVLVLGAILTGYLGIYWILFSSLRNTPLMQPGKESPRKPKFPLLNRILMAIVIVVAVTLAFILYDGDHASGDDYSSSTESSSVITEEPESNKTGKTH